MARRGRRKFRRYLRGQISFTFDFGSLASKDLVLAPVPDVLTEKAWLSSVKSTYSLTDVTDSTQDAGPVLVGIAHSDYTAAEVEAWIENLGSWEQGDKISQEIAKRMIRRVGVFPGKDANNLEQAQVLNLGRPITTKCGWQLTTGQTVDFWVYNMGTGVFATTTPTVHFEGHANLWPN